MTMMMLKSERSLMDTNKEHITRINKFVEQKSSRLLFFFFYAISIDKMVIVVYDV